MSREFIQYERQNWVGLLTINRPKVLNALNRSVIAEMKQLLDEIAQTDIRCLIVTGAGEKAFAAGADIEEMWNLTVESAKTFSQEGNAFMNQLECFPVPTIAAINGFALGGGLELALACDIRIAAATAVFAAPETALGVLPGYGGIQRLARTVGLSKAKEVVFTCDRISAEAALSLGLVCAVVPINKLLQTAFEMAKKISNNAPIGIKAAKSIANSSVGVSLECAKYMEVELFAACFETSDQRMAMSAFLEKKKPEPFSGK